MTEINVGLYGGKSIFGGKETPLRASIVSCEMFNECSYYKAGTCLAVLSPSSGRCKFGKVSTVNGYTSRARKYSDFQSKWKSHESYGKLKDAPTKLGVINEDVVFPYSFITLKVENETVTVDGPGFADKNQFIPKNMFNVELIHKLCIYRPQAFFGGTIQSYKDEVVPLFLSHLKEVMPELYAEFTERYPQFKEIDYVGRKALLKTIAPSKVEFRSKRYPNLNETWDWDGTHLTYQSGYVSRFKVADDYEIVEITIEPKDNTKIIITNNEQVTERTVFLD
ncbi:hypothetical protein M3629_03650 [Paenibacillus polysaccharolyticus]|uniref:hypothetical protein n=1 Tax=Paenibacillus polysaccharolyticus TaxID=582692 RepID=UPI00203EB433|nr:hypothetical protein [Paenibacillus polysaccharolyticus]MCM3131862.1 hypothetical protein [Paenibacillus polysaccharolyticus]